MTPVAIRDNARSVFNMFAGVILAAIVSLTFASSQADAQSVWDKIKAEAQKAQQPGQRAKPAAGQPAGQPPKPGQPVAKPGQPAQGVSSTGAFTPPPSTQITPEVMGPYTQGLGFSVSPVGVHVSIATDSGSRRVILYDGVSGPKLDQIYTPGNASGVVYSPDGNHWAYVGVLGSDWVLYRDGKEFTRASVSPSTVGQTINASGDFHFTPDGQHLYYTDMRMVNPSTSQNRLVLDNKPGPWGGVSNGSLIFSPDGDHLAYLFNAPTSDIPTEQFVIDTQVQPYTADNIQFSADSKHIYSWLRATASGTKSTPAVAMLDGKPVIRADDVHWFIPPVGDMAVAVVHKITGATTFSEALIIGGKIVPGSETVNNGRYQNIVFSPDGKHYASIVQNNQSRNYVFTDGKKQQEYAGIQGPNNKELIFTADSSSLIYVASNNSANLFLVINGEESNGVPMLSQPVVGTKGNHSITAGRTQILADGKPLNLPGVDMTISNVSFISFSPDGNHFAFVLQNRNGRVLYVDGAAVPGYSVAYDSGMLTPGTLSYVWSPGSQHFAFVCRSSNPAAGNDIDVCLDNKALDIGTGSAYNLIFSSDSKHLFWQMQAPLGGFRAFIDGKPVFDGKYPFTSLMFEPFQPQSDGSLRFLTIDQSNNLARVSITPSPSTSLGTILGGQ